MKIVKRQTPNANPLLPWLFLLTVQRLGAVLLLRPGGWFYDYSDYHTYWQYARWYAEGFWPYRDYWLEYPPLFPLLNHAVYAVSVHLPPLGDGRFWHHLLLALTLLPADLGVATLLHRLAARLGGAARAEWTLAVWALLFAPLFVWQGYFDGLLLFALLLTVWALVERRPAWAGVALAFGFLAKLLSVLALPAALWVFARGAQRAKRRAQERKGEGGEGERGRGGEGAGGTGIRGRGTSSHKLLQAPTLHARGRWSSLSRLVSRNNGVMLGVFGLGVAAVLVPLWIIGPEWMRATVQNFGGRGAWQTVWALADGFYGSGIVYGDRFDPTPEFARVSSRIPWLLVHAAFGALGAWLWLRRWRWERPVVPIAFLTATLCLFFLWSKGWSPQYTVLLLPWLLLLWPNTRGLVLALGFSTLMIGENLYYNFVVYRYPDALPLLFALVILRTFTLALVAFWSVRLLAAQNRGGSSMQALGDEETTRGQGGALEGGMP